ncbi:hypothetical protein [Glycomyces albidus]|uniref:Uncharacterized protein n=1 Tax=Glycomyces albidus TaxID=2656774 RepID=A0A6L5GC62_9ACTN|nr:hypothetical protein [Glycomyces albidus]MQM27228.1 hypothetical protein [Glycomyces albidus]
MTDEDQRLFDEDPARIDRERISSNHLLRIRAEFLSLVVIGLGTSAAYAVWTLGYFLGSAWQPLFTIAGLLFAAGLLIAFIKISKAMFGDRSSAFPPRPGGLPVGIAIAAGCSSFAIAMAAMGTGRFLGLTVSLAVFSTEFIVWSLVGILIVFRRRPV